MPPILHPRSRTTSTLFTGCLAVSFLVVGMPHLLPCPADRRQYADSGDGPRRVKRRRRVVEDDGEKQEVAEGAMAGSKSGMVDAQRAEGRTSGGVWRDTMEEMKGRECPVPKPSGIIGRLMGFKEDGERDGAVVVVGEGVGRRRVVGEKGEGGEGKT